MGGVLLIALCGCGLQDKDAVQLAGGWDTALHRLDERHVVKIRVHAHGSGGRELDYETIDPKTIANCVDATHRVEPVRGRQFNQPDSIQFIDGRGSKSQMHINFFDGRRDLGPQMTACFDDLERSPKK